MFSVSKGFLTGLAKMYKASARTYIELKIADPINSKQDLNVAIHEHSISIVDGRKFLYKQPALMIMIDTETEGVSYTKKLDKAKRLVGCWERLPN